MIAFELTIDIHRPRRAVWSFLMELNNYSRWQSGVVSRRATRGLGLGSLITVVSTSFGMTHETVVEVVENDGQSRLRLMSRGKGTFMLDSTLELETVDAHTTRVHCRQEIAANVVFRLAEPVLQSLTEARTEGDLQLLKQVMEAEPTSPA